MSGPDDVNDGVGQAADLPDFVDPREVSHRSLEASHAWGSDAPPAASNSADVDGRGGTSEPSSSARGSKGSFGNSTRRAAGGKKRSKKPLTWQEKQARREKRAAKRAEADAAEREKDPMGHAREIVLTSLSAAPKSRAQLAEKLRDREVDDDVAEAVLDRMEDVGLVNDGEYAGMLVRSKVASRGLARRALRQELSRKGIDEATASVALEQLDDDTERDTARQLVDKKLRTMSRLDRDTKIRRLLGLLGRKGYATSLAWSVIREAIDEAADLDGEP